MTDDRPKRLYIPLDIRRQAGDLQGNVCPCGCGTPCWADEKRTKARVQWDHMPALILRDLDGQGDYTPHQLDPKYLVGRCTESHRRKTRGSGATTAGTDIGIRKKERKRSKPPKVRKRMPSRPMVHSPGKNRWAPGRKLQSRPFQKRRPT